MSPKPAKVPTYCLHKPSGRAVIYIDRRPIYLGTYGSEESYQNYEREISRWRTGRAANGLPQPQAIRPSDCLTVNELILAYLVHAQTYYVDAAGELTKEYTEMKLALRPLRIVHGQTLTRDFGPVALKEVRQWMVESRSLSRSVVNHRVNRIRRMFKWAVSEQYAPPDQLAAMREIEPLKRGRTTAHENKPIKPVSQEFVDPVVAAAYPHIAAMIQLQQLGGMRPQEVTRMRACDIDMTRDVWIYVPVDHKGSWREKERSPIFLGRKAQEIIRPFLLHNKKSETYLFSPREAENWRNEQRRLRRTTPMTPSHGNRSSKKLPERPRRDRYDTDSYRRAIKYTIKRVNRERKRRGEAELPAWCPLQLRHSRATEIRKNYGIEAAQVFLGHEHADITQVYAERDLEVGFRIARELG